MVSEKNDRSVVELTVRPRQIALVLAVIVACLAALGLVAAYIAANPQIEGTFKGDKILRDQFRLDSENNVPTWFASTLLLCIGGVAAALGRLGQSNKTDRRLWYLLAGVFVFLSLDEAASFHETVNSGLRDAFDLTGALRFAWVIPGLVFVGILGVLFFGFVRRLPSPERFWVFAAGAVFILGAIGLEMVGGAYRDSHDALDFGYGIITTIEETLEMIGLVMFSYALTSLVARWAPMGVFAVAADREASVAEEISRN